MAWYSQLTRLIFDYYREDPDELLALKDLSRCKLSRWWGTFRINCTDLKIASDFINKIDLIRQPIAQLRLAQNVKVMVNGKAIASFPVQVENFYNQSFKKH